MANYLITKPTIDKIWFVIFIWILKHQIYLKNNSLYKVPRFYCGGIMLKTLHL